MKKVFARFINVLAAVGLLLCAAGLYWYFAEKNTDAIGGAIGLLIFVGILNYVFLGKATIWNEIEE